jgi:hypothetical protein
MFPATVPLFEAVTIVKVVLGKTPYRLYLYGIYW